MTNRVVLLLLVALAGCAHQEYPPAYPASYLIPWLENYPLVPVTPPPPDLAWKDEVRQVLREARFVPTKEEWKLWQERTGAKQVCRRKGKQRKCETVLPSNAVDVANKQAVVRATLAHTNMGNSIKVRYQLEEGTDKAYEILTSPGETTTLFFPPGERQVSDFVLPGKDWEVANGKQGLSAQGEHTPLSEFMVVHPQWTGMTTRATLVFRSGLTIPVSFTSREQPGMLSVVWELPPKAPEPPPIPIDKQPPLFDKSRAYQGYTLTLASKSKYQPAWWPEAVLDDGHNTLIKFKGSLDGIRMPVVQGINQAGKPELVQSRLFVREEYGAFLYVAGLWPALMLKDAAGLAVQATRQPPATPGKDASYVQTRQVSTRPQPRTGRQW